MADAGQFILFLPSVLEDYSVIDNTRLPAMEGSDNFSSTALTLLPSGRDADAVAPGFFGFEHGGVCLLDKIGQIRLDGCSFGGIARHAEGGGDPDMMLVGDAGLVLDGSPQTFRQGPSLLLIGFR